MATCRPVPKNAFRSAPCRIFRATVWIGAAYPLEFAGGARIITFPSSDQHARTVGAGQGRAPLAPELKFVVADDHPLFRGALRQTLASAVDNATILEAGTFAETKKIVSDTDDIDLVLLDLTMPGASGLSGLVALRAINSTAPVMVVSARDDVETIRRAIDLGASGFISKSASMDEIRKAVETVLAGGLWIPSDVDLGTEMDPEISDLIQRLQTLTPQQARVLSMIAEGLLNKQIAFELSVSEATIKAHVSAVLQKLNVDSRTQAVIQLQRIGSDALQVSGS